MIIVVPTPIVSTRGVLFYQACALNLCNYFKTIHYTKAFLCSQPNVTSFLLRVYPKELGCWPDLINQVSSGNGLQPVNIDADEEKRDKEGQKSRDGMLLMQMIRDL